MNTQQGFTGLESTLQRWLASAEPAGSNPEADARALERHVHDGERMLAELPSKLERGVAQQDVADRIHRSCRALRTSFMKAHANWVYDTLTECKSERLRLPELAYGAAQAFPGLVPTREQIGRELECTQDAKEAREIDQGIFFSALLGAPQCGIHLLETMLRPSQKALDQLARFRASGRLRLDTIDIERRGATAHLTVHNEACLNSEDGALIDDMETAVDLVLLDDEVRVCVLRGSPMTHPKYAGRRVFSAGINLKQLHQGQISYVDFLLKREMGYISKILRGLQVEPDGPQWPSCTLEKPWIAAVDTFAIGGGAQLLLVFDRVIGAADSFFSLPAAQEGIVPGVANLRLGRATGARMARQIVLCGRKVWANEADGKLLFDEVVEPNRMDAAIDANAAHLASPAVIANRHMLALAEEPLELFRIYMASFALEQAKRLYSQDVLDKVRLA
jgi:thioesterase DpgC